MNDNGYFDNEIKKAQHRAAALTFDNLESRIRSRLRGLLSGLEYSLGVPLFGPEDELNLRVCGHLNHWLYSRTLTMTYVHRVRGVEDITPFCIPGAATDAYGVHIFRKSESRVPFGRLSVNLQLSVPWSEEDRELMKRMGKFTTYTEETETLACGTI